jgi:integrase
VITVIGKKKNFWYFRIRVYDYVQGKNIDVYRSGFKTKKEASEASHEFAKSYEPKTEQYSVNSTFDDAFTEYLENRKRKIKITAYYNELPTFNKHILSFFSGIKLRQITNQLFNRWIKEMEIKQLSISYKNHILNTLKQIAVLIRRRYKIDLQFIEEEPSFRSDKYIENEKNIYTLEQAEKLIDMTDDVIYKTLFTVMFYSGMRLGEIRALNWNDYNGHGLSVRKSINTRIKKHIGEPMITTPKTKKSVRIVPLPLIATKRLNQYKVYCENKIGFSDGWYIFGDTEPLSETTLRRKLLMFSKQSNLHYVTPHGFRHSYTTLLYTLKVPDEIARETLGHESIETTRNIYTHISSKTVSDVLMDSFDKLDS